MAKLVDVRDLERRGLRHHVRLLKGADGDELRVAISSWCDEATQFLISSDLVEDWLKESLSSQAPLPAVGWVEPASSRLHDLCDRLHEFDDVQVRLTGGRAFISYVQEDAVQVDRLAHALRASGIVVWLDRKDLPDTGGLDWRETIRSQIDQSAHFIACYSKHWSAKPSSYAHEELELAVDRLREVGVSSNWFLPVQLEPDSIPHIEVTPSTTLRDFQAYRLYDGWYEGCADIADAILPLSGNVGRVAEKLSSPSLRIRREGVENTVHMRDARLLVPLLAAWMRESNRTEGRDDMISYEILRAVRDIGLQSEELSDLALPMFAEMLEEREWTYKVIEAMERQPSDRVQAVLEAYRTTQSLLGTSFGALLGDDNMFAIDLAELRKRAEAHGNELRASGLLP